MAKLISKSYIVENHNFIVSKFQVIGETNMIKGFTIRRNQSKVKPLKVASQAEVLVLDEKQALLSAESILRDFGDVFKDLRHIGTSRFVVDPSAVPVQHTSRHIPVALKREVAGKLTGLERNGIMVKKQPVQSGSAIIVIVAAKN